MIENNKITVPIEVTASEAMAENEFLRNRKLVLATLLQKEREDKERLQTEIENLKKEKENMQAEIERLTARLNAPQPIVYEAYNEEVEYG